MRYLASHLAQFVENLRAYISPPWTFDKIAIDAGGIFAAIVLYGVIRTNWIAEFRAVPGRFRWAWYLNRKDLGQGLAMAAAGVVLGWATYNRFHVPKEWGFPPLLIMGLMALSMTLTGAFYVATAVLALIFSPLGENAPSYPGLDAVRQQKAYGDARAANAVEVDSALRGGSSGPQHEFKD